MLQRTGDTGTVLKTDTTYGYIVVSILPLYTKWY